MYHSTMVSVSVSVSVELIGLDWVLGPSTTVTSSRLQLPGTNLGTF